MKTGILLSFLLISIIGSSQELMNYHIEPSTINNTVDLYTLVYRSSFSSFDGYSISNVDNNITITLCYLNTSATTETFDFQNFEINLPIGYSSYILNIEVYGDNDALPPCSFDILVDTGIIDFNYPYNPTEKTTIPDNAFEDFLENLEFGDDVFNNDLVYTHRIVNMSHLFLSNLFTVESMEGIDEFIALKDLRFSNNLVTNVDLSSNLLLERLFCDHNPLIQLDLSNNNLLKNVLCNFTNITTLELSNNIDLESLNIGSNNITTIDLSQNISLVHLDFSNCQFSNIDLSNNTFLEFLDCSNNLLTSLNLSNSIYLESLFCQNNQLTILNIDGSSNFKHILLFNNLIATLDLSSNSQLELVLIYSNNLASLNLKNGNNLNITSLSAGNNDNLYCIDVDDDDAANNGEFPYSGWNVDSQVVYSEDCTLGIEEVLETGISIYPNPVKDLLIIDNTINTEITSIKLYDVLGRFVLVEKGNVNLLDVSVLTSGLLFLEIETDKGLLIKKIIKE